MYARSIHIQNLYILVLQRKISRIRLYTWDISSVDGKGRSAIRCLLEYYKGMLYHRADSETTRKKSTCNIKFTMNNLLDFTNTILEVTNMDKKTQEQIQEQKNHDKFNSVTQKVTPENQNQTHNTRKEGIQPINQKK